ncbi:hypothetical protein HQ585_14445 [candidate division KSB1 bacterium]|nr:hypothetical protein [candidate division KSB1 bacterium]
MDSVLVRECASISGIMFVSIECENAAEELFLEAKELLNTAAAMHRCIDKMDSDATSEKIISDINSFDLPLTFKVKFRQVIAHEDIQKACMWIKNEVDNYYQLAELKLQEVCQKNPFHLGAGVELVKLLMLQGRTDLNHQQTDKYFQSAMNELDRLILLDQSNHHLISLKGEIEIELNDWESAKYSFQKASELLFNYAFLPTDLTQSNIEISVDTTIAFKYILFLIQTHIKLYESDQALMQIEGAEIYANNEDRCKILEDYRGMINWADGDIRSRELFVEAIAYEEENEFNESVNKHHEILKRMDSKLSEAFIETSYHLSLLEYKHFKQDPSYLNKYGVQNIGMGRLRNIIKRLNQNQYGVPQDSLARNYFEIFGTMLFNEGIKAVEEKYHALAMTYFLQGSLFHSSYQAKCSLELAKLVMHHGEIGFRWALHAYSQIQAMTEDEKKQLYPLLRFVTKRVNQPELCQFFHDEFHSFLQSNEVSTNRKIRLMGYEFLRAGYVDLQKYCEQTYHIQYNPSSIHEFAQKYINDEIVLPKPMKKQIRGLIDQAYQKQNREDALKNWKSFIHQVPL